MTTTIHLSRSTTDDGQQKVEASCSGIEVGRQLVGESIEMLLPQLEESLGLRFESAAPPDTGWIELGGMLWAVAHEGMFRAGCPFPSRPMEWRRRDALSLTVEQLELKIAEWTSADTVTVSQSISSRNRDIVELQRSDGQMLLVDGNLLRNLRCGFHWSQAAASKASPIFVHDGTGELSAAVMPIHDHEISMIPEIPPNPYWPISIVLRPHLITHRA